MSLHQASPSFSTFSTHSHSTNYHYSLSLKAQKEFSERKRKKKIIQMSADPIAAISTKDKNVIYNELNLFLEKNPETLKIASVDHVYQNVKDRISVNKSGVKIVIQEWIEKQYELRAQVLIAKKLDKRIQETETIADEVGRLAKADYLKESHKIIEEDEKELIDMISKIRASGKEEIDADIANDAVAPVIADVAAVGSGGEEESSSEDKLDSQGSGILIVSEVVSEAKKAQQDTN